MKEQVDAIFKAVDKDSDEKITIPETLQFFKSGSSKVTNELRYIETRHHAGFLQFKAEDTVAYHDQDDDTVVTRKELWESLVQWNVVVTRIREGLKLVNQADRKGLEEFEKSFDYLRREPVEIPSFKKLRPELKELFSLKSGTTILPSLKGINSLSDSEWYSNTRETVHHLLSKQKKEKKAKSPKTDL
eukprot:gnl/TRDRNA2_/TRDRNA2_40046_c0_seq1.p1 gnl/TRDRNA2_/TRDRNA2_40046_c0~~gnl/TRDRNA2_/TRDRNA2_40046_c0_seq1.p1  ORF type:complete len:215 (+),score=57.60 gnl/TRDRNA2_/TRDRNA2_40046_c0_seq1:83-646(+)